jgi:galactokinase
MSDLLSEIETHFNQNYDDDSSAFTVRAPGRVNLIGEHVDYNDGFVLPMAIPLQTVFRIRPRGDTRVELFAVDLGQKAGFSLDDIQKQDSWIDYVAGVARELQEKGVALSGFEGVVASTVPMASGLSSSATMEVGTALIFLHLASQTMSAPDVAVLCQRAENLFVGVNSGIMDQMAVAACEQNHALLLDCRSLELKQIPFKLADHVVIVTDSAAPRELAGSAYNERRAQCEEGLAILQKQLPEVQSLRDVTPQDLDTYAALLPPVVEKRVRHVVEEIARTQEAVHALQEGDFVTMGMAMNDSHRSLAELYEVSSVELDWLTAWARRQPGVLGSRLTGAGFGGCTVTLIEKVHADDFMKQQPLDYKATIGRDARCWICDAAPGAEVLG